MQISIPREAFDGLDLEEGGAVVLTGSIAEMSDAGASITIDEVSPASATMPDDSDDGKEDHGLVILMQAAKRKQK